MVQQGAVVKSAAAAAAWPVLRTTSGTPPRVQRACNPCCKARKVSPAATSAAPPRVAEYQLEQQVGVGLSGHLAPQWVKSNWSRRMHLGEVHLLIRTMQRPPPEPGRACNRRCSVRSWDALNRPGCCSASQSIIVVPSACRPDHSAAAQSHPPTPRRRDPAECATDAPVSPATAMAHSATCALNARSSQPWPLPFPVSCLPYVSASIA